MIDQDIIDTLVRIEKQAKATLHRLDTGEAKNGVNGLSIIKHEAGDLLDRIRNEQQRSAA